MSSTQAPTTMTRWRWTLTTLDEVEHYLSQMCAEGWAPVSIAAAGGRFVFARTAPGEYVCSSAATVKMSGATAGSFDREKYAQLAALIEDQGGAVVPQTGTWGDQEGIVAVRRADQGPLVINSDTGSRIDDLKARRQYCVTLASTFLPIAVVFLPLVPSMGAAFIGICVCFLAIAAEYGRHARKYSTAIKRLEQSREVFE